MVLFLCPDNQLKCKAVVWSSIDQDRRLIRDVHQVIKFDQSSQ